MLADGRVLVTGGVLQTYTTGDARRGEGWKGLNRTFTFDPVTKQWQEHEQMRKGRYYPTQLLMADGRSVVVQGWDESGFQRDNLDLELFRPRQAARRGGRPARHRAGLGFSAQDAPNPALVRTWGTGVLLPLRHDATRARSRSTAAPMTRVPSRTSQPAPRRSTPRPPAGGRVSSPCRSAARTTTRCSCPMARW